MYVFVSVLNLNVILIEANWDEFECMKRKNDALKWYTKHFFVVFASLPVPVFVEKTDTETNEQQQ